MSAIMHCSIIMKNLNGENTERYLKILIQSKKNIIGTMLFGASPPNYFAIIKT